MSLSYDDENLHRYIYICYASLKKSTKAMTSRLTLSRGEALPILSQKSFLGMTSYRFWDK